MHGHCPDGPGEANTATSPAMWEGIHLYTSLLLAPKQALPTGLRWTGEGVEWVVGTFPKAGCLLCSLMCP